MALQLQALLLFLSASVAGEASSHELPELICPGVSHKLWLDIYSSCNPRGSIIQEKEWSW
jgi:hypothetical protein